MRKILIALLAATTLAGAASAQTTPPPPAPGATTRAEAMANADAMFTRDDANRDGTVTPDERRAARAAMRAARGQDGPPPGGPRGMMPPPERAMTRAEALARAGERFDRIDTNHDGRLDATEIAAMRAERRAARAGDAPPPAQ